MESNLEKEQTKKLFPNIDGGAWLMQPSSDRRNNLLTRFPADLLNKNKKTVNFLEKGIEGTPSD
jgi:hypothetical protein